MGKTPKPLRLLNLQNITPQQNAQPPRTKKPLQKSTPQREPNQYSARTAVVVPTLT
jgi:hypothetical protein